MLQRTSNYSEKTINKSDIERDKMKTFVKSGGDRSHTYKERDKIVGLQNIDNSDDHVVPFCNKYRTYGDGREPEHDNSRYKPLSNMRYEGVSGGGSGGGIEKTNENEQSARKVIYKIQRCNSMPVKNPDDKNLQENNKCEVLKSFDNKKVTKNSSSKQ